MPRNITLPDGRVLTIPDDASPDQLAALRNKLAAKYADLTSGAGMEQYAQQAAKVTPASNMKPVTPWDGPTVPRPPGGGEEATLASGAMPGLEGLSTVGTVGALRTNPVAAIRAIGSSVAGAYGAGHAGKYLAGDTGEKVGKVVGGIAGGILGGAGLNPRASLFDILTGSDAAASEPTVIPMSQSPNAAEYAATKAAQRAVLLRDAKGAAGIPTLGSPAQEAGYMPSVTKIPIRSEPSSPLTPESIAGPSTAGKKNLLTPLAKQGDPRAAMELVRRGKKILFTPDESFTGGMSADDFRKMLAGLDQ